MAINAARLAATPSVRQVADSAFLVGAAHRGNLQCLADTFECNERRALEVTDVRTLLLLRAELTSSLFGAERRLIEEFSAREGTEEREEKKKRSHDSDIARSWAMGKVFNAWTDLVESTLRHEVISGETW